MTQAAQRLKEELSQLSPRDRAELAGYLLDSLDAATDVDADSEWADELDRRAGQIRSGTVEGVPAEQVIP